MSVIMILLTLLLALLIMAGAIFGSWAAANVIVAMWDETKRQAHHLLHRAPRNPADLEYMIELKSRTWPQTQPEIGEPAECRDCGMIRMLDDQKRCDLCVSIANAEAAYWWGHE